MSNRILLPGAFIPLVHDGEVEEATGLLTDAYLARMVVVSGELGVGKSTVLARVAANLAALGYRVRYIWNAADVPTEPSDAPELWVIDDLHAVPAAEVGPLVRSLSGAMSHHLDVRVLASVDASQFAKVRSEVGRMSALVQLSPVSPEVAMTYADGRAAHSSRSARSHVIDLVGGNLALLDQAIRDLEGDERPASALLNRGISRLPARYEHLSEAYLVLPARVRRLLTLVAVLGAGRVSMSPMTEEERTPLLDHVREEQAFLRRAGEEHFRFTSNVHRAVVIVSCASDDLQWAHQRAAEAEGASARDRAVHHAVGSGCDATAVDAALSLGPSPVTALSLLWKAAEVADDPAARESRLLAVARVALAEGDLVLAAAALTDSSVQRGGTTWSRTAAEMIDRLQHADVRSTAPGAPRVLDELLEQLEAVTGRSASVVPAGSSGMLRALRHSWSLVGRGDWQEAERTLTPARIEAARGAIGFVDVVASGYLALVEALQGRTTSAAARARYVLGDINRGRHPIARTPAWQAQLHLAVAGDQIAVAQAVAHMSTPLLRVLAWTPYPVGLLMDYVDAGCLDLDGSSRFELEGGELGEAHPFGAAYSRAMREPDHQVNLLGELLADGGSRARPFETARVRFRYGLALARAHRAPQARSQLLAAAAEFERCGAAAWQDRAVAAAGELTRTPSVEPLRTGAITTPLTFQEERVVTLAATGLSNKEISRRLYLSPRTVGGHLYNAYPKLGVTSRAALRDALLRREADGAERMDSAS